MAIDLTRREIPVVRITAGAVPQQAFTDFIGGGRLYRLWSRLAFHDIRQRFRRSVLGPLWLTLSMGVLIGAMGLVFSQLFNQEISQTLPYIATGIIFWSFLTSCINDGTVVFVGAESFIRNVPMPVSVHFYRMMARNVFIWLFNMVIYLVIIVVFQIAPGWPVVLFIPGLLLFFVNAAWMSLASAILSTRYRDIPQVINNVIQVVFFVTPVFWSPAGMGSRADFIEYNPFYHLLNIVRAPLLGEWPENASWLFCIAMAVAGIAFTTWLYRRAHARIAYWV